MEQNSLEWHEFRKNHVGASDAPVIMGVSPWKTAYQLWEEKLGLREIPASNAAMQRGIELEPIARQAYNDYTGNEAEAKVIVHPQYSWMSASLDGLSKCGSVPVEIKCPGYDDHQKAVNGEIPEKYFPQLQHQLAVLGVNMLHYFSYRDGSYCLLEVMRDEKYIARLIKEESKFWNGVLSFSPPELSERDYINKNDKEWLDLVESYRTASEELNRAKEAESLIRDQLINLSEGRNCIGGGVKVQKIIRKGTVDYSKIPELKGVNLDGYRKDSVSSWRITI